MHITVYNSKGGVGKTPIAVNLALSYDCPIATNERFNILETFIPDDQLLQVNLSDEFPPIPENLDIVFDLAGTIDENAKSIISALEQSDVLLVPVNHDINSIFNAQNVIAETQQYVDRIIIVTTMLKASKSDVLPKSLGASARWRECEEFKNIKNRISEKSDINLDFQPLKHSTAFRAIFENEKSIEDIAAENPLLSNAYKDVIEQFNDLKQLIKG